MNTMERIGKLTTGTGCDACRQSGYRGRVGIFELLLVDDVVRSKVQERAMSFVVFVFLVATFSLSMIWNRCPDTADRPPCK